MFSIRCHRRHVTHFQRYSKFTDFNPFKSIHHFSTTSITPSKSIYIFGTFDTKGDEISFLSQSISSKLRKWSDPAVSNTTIKMVDISTSRCITYSDSDTNSESTIPVDITCRDLISNWNELSSLDRSDSAHRITESLRAFIESEYTADKMCGAIAIGGSGGTAMASAAFTESLPLGFPKIIVSTVASSAMTEEYIGHSDLILMPSVVDVSGINGIYKTIAENAACCMVGMAQNYAMKQLEAPHYTSESGKNGKVFTVGVTMFGITTQSVEFIKHKLYSKYGENVNVLVFHATGTGGKCMEYLINNGYIDGVIDLTTTEVADYIVGGVMPCTSDRFDAAMNIQIPTVLSLGAANVVNFGSMSSIPQQFTNDSSRIWQPHNEQVTLMKANDDELADIAEFIASKVNEFESEEISLLFPKNGISALDAKGSIFPFAEYAKSDIESLSTNLIKNLNDESVLKFVDSHINDECFADAVVSEFASILDKMDIVIDAADKKGNDRGTVLHKIKIRIFQSKH